MRTSLLLVALLALLGVEGSYQDQEDALIRSEVDDELIAHCSSQAANDTKLVKKLLSRGANASAVGE